MKTIGFLMLILGLSSCSHYTTNGESQYVYSRNGPGLLIPPPLEDNNISHFYDLPLQTQSPRVSIAPPF